eukprot:SAG31_NODE_31329_length_369_cov_1.033333_2_plen_30_part_01
MVYDTKSVQFRDDDGASAVGVPVLAALPGS